MSRATITLLIALCAALPARAADVPADTPAAPPPGDLDALSLADKPDAAPVQQARKWRLVVESGAGQDQLRTDGSRLAMARASLDIRFDDSVAQGLRAVLSDRLDGVHSHSVPPGENINTLREAYLSWARTENQNVDFGRVNLRNGAALGFNPTDWFKANALRSITSPDPAVLRENRQGTVVLQAQQLWREAALTAAFSPRLGSSTDRATFALDAGATNPSPRWLLAGSVKVNDKFNPQMLVYGGADTPTQLGLNLSGLVGDAAVAYGEFTTGKGISLISQAIARPEAESRQQRAAVGLTYTTAFNLSLTAEADYSSAGARRQQWYALPVGARQLLLSTALQLQDLPLRREWFFHAAWKDLLVQRLDLSGFLRLDTETTSRSAWLEARYHWEQADLALQWQRNAGDPGSLYAAVPQRQRVQVVLRVFL